MKNLISIVLAATLALTTMTTVFASEQSTNTSAPTIGTYIWDMWG